jgi:dipeptidase E
MAILGARLRPRGVFAGKTPAPMCDLGWKSLGLLEITALPTIPAQRWMPWIEQADVLLVDGGDAMYLSHWMRESGLVDLVPPLADKVWVGVSAGSMVMTPRVGDEFVSWASPAGGDRALAIVDFSIFPHLDHDQMPQNSMANAEKWASRIGSAAYAIDDQTAIKVVDGTAEIVSEGRWRFFPPNSESAA